MQSHLNSIMDVILKWLRRAVYLLMGFIMFYGFINQFLLPEDIRNWPRIILIIIFAGAVIVFTALSKNFRLGDQTKLAVLLAVLTVFIFYLSFLVYGTNPFGIAFLGLIAVLSVISYKLGFFILLNIVMFGGSIFLLFGRPTAYEVLSNHQRTGAILFLLISIFSYFIRSGFRQVIDTLDSKMTEADKLHIESLSNYENTKEATKVILDQLDNLKLATAKSKTLSKEVTTAVSDIAIGSGSQASDLQESVRELEELSEEINGVRTNVRVAIDELRSREADSEEGFKIIQELKDTSIKSTKLNKTIEDEIAGISDGFLEIIASVETINSIAAQTNLLALNASIESARLVKLVKALQLLLMKYVSWQKRPPKVLDVLKKSLTTLRNKLKRPKTLCQNYKINLPTQMILLKLQQPTTHLLMKHLEKP